LENVAPPEVLSAGRGHRVVKRTSRTIFTSLNLTKNSYLNLIARAS